MIIIDNVVFNSDAYSGYLYDDFEKLSQIIDIIVTSLNTMADDLEKNYSTREQTADSLNTIIGAAPDVLNTLAEISTALGDDADFAANTRQKISELTTALADLATKVEDSANSSHNHTINEITSLTAELASKSDKIETESALKNKANAIHGHTIKETEGLEEILNSKADKEDTEQTLSTKADKVTTTTALAGKAAISHTHSELTAVLTTLQENINSVTTKLSNKSESDHSHSQLHTHINTAVLAELTTALLAQWNTAYTHSQQKHDFAPGSHDHDVDYASSSHTHDSRYASQTHNHNTDYARLAHTHTDIADNLEAINLLLKSDNLNLDTMQEVVDFITDNAETITARVKISDIVNNLTTAVANKPLAANQGKILKSLIDSLTAVVNGKASIHSHPYAPATHNHDKDYAAAAHNHATDYAVKEHNHDTDYPSLSHSHNELHTHSNKAALDIVTNTGFSNRYLGEDGKYHTLIGGDGHTHPNENELATITTVKTATWDNAYAHSQSAHNYLASTGTAAKASKLATARTISVSGDCSGSISFDGSSNKTLALTVKDDSHNHTIANIDGLQPTLDSKAPVHSHPYAATAHIHTVGQVNGLQNVLDNKANVHSHPYALTSHNHDTHYAPKLHGHDAVSYMSTIRTTNDLYTILPEGE